MTDTATAHYPSLGAMRADLVVHIVGLVFALFGGGLLLGLAFSTGSLPQAAAVLIYVGGFIAMLAFSTAYNFTKAPSRPLLRRLDHVGIFLMIAGSYTPFTTQKLPEPWAIGMTAAVWGLAGAGICAKLFLPGLDRRFWVGLYVALGWIALIALKPMIDNLSWIALLLLTIGGVVYSTGAAIYVIRKLKFRRAIWHGHVVGGSIIHWVAVLVGVMLARGA